MTCSYCCALQMCSLGHRSCSGMIYMPNCNWCNIQLVPNSSRYNAWIPFASRQNGAVWSHIEQSETCRVFVITLAFISFHTRFLIELLLTLPKRYGKQKWTSHIIELLLPSFCPFCTKFLNYFIVVYLGCAINKNKLRTVAVTVWLIIRNEIGVVAMRV